MIALLIWAAGTFAGTGAESGGGLQTTEGWAFRPVVRPEVPGGSAARGRNPVDLFVEARLAARGLKPNPPASPRELVRRLYFDLIGLPPSPETTRNFEQHHSPADWAALVDRLLSSPQYGERWARHWLDVVRFAQSNGYERDGEKPYAWRYRDYVIGAFNQDKPYNRFVREQIAGDEIAASMFASGVEGATNGWPEAITATGFLRLGVMDDEPDDKLQATFDALDDIVSTTGSAFLGLTLGCARCHDHKFDPIPQKDYYSLLAFFRGLRLSTQAAATLDSDTLAPLAPPDEVARWQEGHQRGIAALEAKLAGTREESARKGVETELARLKGEALPFPMALAAREVGGEPPAVHVLSRGNPRSPGIEVRPAFPGVLGGGEPSIPSRGTNGSTSGRRRALANWVAGASNPLTARVLVNRVWHEHFGRGIVRTTTDFGRAGARASHPELLDWLASEFVEGGWSIKALHRMILTSETWKRSSHTGNEAARAADPGNELLWRQNLRRLDAESLRDSILAISGNLNLAPGGRGFFPHLSGEVLAGGSRPGTDWEVSSFPEECRRSVYTYVRRTSMVPMMEVFDYSNLSSPLGERPVTTVAPQALLFLNDAFVQRESGIFAARLTGDLEEGGRVRAPAPGLAGRLGRKGGREELIRRGWVLATGRAPSPRETGVAVQFLERQIERFRQAASRESFRPDVPDTLSTPFFSRLPPEQFLVGPSQGWSYARGRWPREYEGNKNMEPGRGPFALRESEPFLDGRVECLLEPEPACDRFSLLLRTESVEGVDLGYELALDPKSGACELIRRAGAETSEVLGSVRHPVPAGTPFPVRVELAGARIRAWVGTVEGAGPVLDVVDPAPRLKPGRVGVRAWGAGLHVDSLHAVSPDARELIPVMRRDDDALARAALESFCLMLLNLNELAYVD